MVNDAVNWQLQEDAQLYETIYRNSPLGIAFSDPKGKIIRVNRLYCEFVGYSEEELIGKNYADFTPPEIMELEILKVREAIKSGSDYYRSEKPLIHKNGEFIWVDLAMSVVRNEVGGIKYILAMINEITDKVQMRKALKESETRLQTQNESLELKVAQRTKEIDEKNKHLVKSNQDLEAFAFAASHDLKEPVRTIGSFTKLFTRKYSDKVDEAGREYLNFIFEAAERLDKLISNLLHYSSTKSTDTSLKLVDIKTLLDNKIKDLNYSIETSKAKITYLDPPSQVLCDESKISMVFHNLISNALKFQEGTTPIVNITAIDNHSCWEFCVADNGIGISKEYQDQVFTLFKRLNTRTDFEGTGIGLNLCQQIVAQHGGKIWIESQKGKGSKFFFTIPKSPKGSIVN